MGTKGLSFYFRIATVLMLICAVCMFFVTVGSAEFYITLFSLILGGAISLVSGILLWRAARKK